MSWWTDFRDGITAPVRSTASLVSDIFAGKNVFDSFGKFTVKNLSAGPAATLLAMPGSQHLGETLAPFTLGLSKDVTDIGAFQAKVNRGQEWKRDDAVKAGLKAGKIALVVGGGVAAGGALGGASTAGQIAAGYAGAGAVSNFVEKPSAESLASSLGGVVGIPPEISDAYKAARAVFSAYKPGENTVKYIGPPTVSGYGSNESGYSTGSQESIIAPMLAIGALTYLAYRVLR